MNKKDKTQGAKAPKALLKAVGRVVDEAVERVLDECKGCALSGGCQERNRWRDHEMVLAAAREALPWIGGGEVGWPNDHTLVILVRRGRKKYKCEDVVVVPPEAIAQMRRALRDATALDRLARKLEPYQRWVYVMVYDEPSFTQSTIIVEQHSRSLPAVFGNVEVGQA